MSPNLKSSPYLVVNLLQGALGSLRGGADGSGIALHECSRGVHVEPAGTGGDYLHPISPWGTPRTLSPAPQELSVLLELGFIPKSSQAGSSHSDAALFPQINISLWISHLILIFFLLNSASFPCWKADLTSLALPSLSHLQWGHLEP